MELSKEELQLLANAVVCYHGQLEIAVSIHGGDVAELQNKYADILCKLRKEMEKNGK